MESLKTENQINEEKRRCTEEKAAPELKAVVQWLLKRNYMEKLAAVLVSQLLDKEPIYKTVQLYQGDLGNDIGKDWESDILFASQHQEFLCKLSAEDIAVSAFTAALISIPAGPVLSEQEVG